MDSTGSASDATGRSESRSAVRLLAKRRCQESRKITYLPQSFVPGPYDILCGRGTSCFYHVGNQRFRQLINDHYDEYVRKQKIGKSMLIDELVVKVRLESPHGGFVKRDKESGLYYEVGDHLAREKTSQAFRDASIDATYGSGNNSRKRARSKAKESKLVEQHSLPNIPQIICFSNNDSSPKEKTGTYEKFPARQLESPPSVGMEQKRTVVRTNPCPNISSSCESSVGGLIARQTGGLALPATVLHEHSSRGTRDGPSPIFDLDLHLNRRNAYREAQHIGAIHRTGASNVAQSSPFVDLDMHLQINQPRSPIGAIHRTENAKVGTPESVIGQSNQPASTTLQRQLAFHEQNDREKSPFLDRFRQSAGMDQQNSYWNDSKLDKKTHIRENSDDTLEKLIQLTMGCETASDPFTPRPLMESENP